MENMHELRISVLRNDYISKLDSELFTSGLEYKKVSSNNFVVYSESDLKLDSLALRLSFIRFGLGGHPIYKTNFIKNPNVKTTLERIQEDSESYKFIKESIDKLNKISPPTINFDDFRVPPLQNN